MLPLALGGNNVLMAHQKYRGPVARALPAEQEVPVDDGFLQIFVHQREQLLQKLMEAEKFPGLVDIRVRHRFVLYHSDSLCASSRA